MILNMTAQDFFSGIQEIPSIDTDNLISLLYQNDKPTLINFIMTLNGFSSYYLSFTGWNKVSAQAAKFKINPNPDPIPDAG